MKRFILYYAVFLTLFTLVMALGCKKEDTYRRQTTVADFNGSILDYLNANATSFDSVLFVLKKSGLADSLKSGDYTFFAPTNQSLLTALSSYNAVRKARSAPPVSLNDIDSSSWRVIMGRYIIRGQKKMSDFIGQDGEILTTVVKRFMHGNVLAINASGASGIGGNAIQFSYDNGSRFTKDWLSALVTTSDIQTTNGIIQILETSHLVGFNYFVNKADTVQNVYSENQTYASGNMNLPNLTVQSWSYRVKKMRTVGANAVDLEAANLIADTLIMRLTILPTDSIVVTSSPIASNSTIKNDGPCYLDESSMTYNLRYKYETASGIVTVAETIKYVAQ